MGWVKKGELATMRALDEWRAEASRLSDGPDDEPLDEDFPKWTSKLCRVAERHGLDPEMIRIVARDIQAGKVIYSSDIKVASLLLSKIESACTTDKKPE